MANDANLKRGAKDDNRDDDRRRSDENPSQDSDKRPARTDEFGLSEPGGSRNM